MQFIYHQDSGKKNISVDGELYKYLFKVRRTSLSDKLYFRNLLDNNLYQYNILDIGKREAQLELVNVEERIIESDKKLHIGWCKIDPKSIEKVIASLNEMGVDKITFIDCEYSQRNNKINFDKLEKLLINSSSQCGRSSIIKIDTCDSLDKFLKLYPDSYMFNFSTNHIDSVKNEIETIVLGCEGGFTQKEIEKFNPNKIVGIDSNLILRSESAVGVITSKIIL